MADCEFLRHCAFFNDTMTDMPSTSSAIKGRYCQGDNSECARYYVSKSQGMERVPHDLFPNQFDIARIISSA